jgi:hypothetical protein
LPQFDEYDCRIEPRSRDGADVETLLARNDVRDRVREAIERRPDDDRDVCRPSSEALPEEIAEDCCAPSLAARGSR